MKIIPDFTPINIQLQKARINYMTEYCDKSIDHLFFRSRRAGGHPPMCNTIVRQTAFDAFYSSMQRYRLSLPPKSPRRHFFLTATFDDGLTSRDAPDYQFAKIERKVRRMLWEQKLDGVCIFQIDTLAKALPGEKAKLQLVHVHGYLWTDDPGFQPTATANVLSARRAFGNRLGVRGIDLVSWSQSCSRRGIPLANRGEDISEESIARVSHYLFKWPAAAKNRTRRSDGGWQTQYDRGALGSIGALRQAEFYSYLTPVTAVFGVGLEGAAVAREYHVEARAALSNYRDMDYLSLSDVRSFWQRLTHPSSRFQHPAKSVL